MRIPLVQELATIYDVSVWEWSGCAYDGVEAAEWFTAFFGNPTRLVRFKEGANLLFFLASEIFQFPSNCSGKNSSLLLADNALLCYIFDSVRD